MGEVIVDDGFLLLIVGIFVGFLLLMVDVVVVFGGDFSVLSQSGDVCYYLLEVYKYLKLILLVGDVWQLMFVLYVLIQGEEGVIVIDVFDMLVVDKLFVLMMVYCVWLRSLKIVVILVQ